jgi:hypothetical protein
MSSISCSVTNWSMNCVPPQPDNIDPLQSPSIRDFEQVLDLFLAKYILFGAASVVLHK